MNTTQLTRPVESISLSTDRVNGIITGFFFITATVAAIIGLKLYDPILQNADYLSAASESASQIILGAIFELILIVAMAGTAIMLFPYLKKFDVRLGLGYITFRLLEGVIILVGLVSMLSVITLSNVYLKSGADVTSGFVAAGTALVAIHDWTFIVGPCFILGINTFIYSYVFFRTRLVPKMLATLGIVGAVLIFTYGLLALFGIAPLFSTVAIIMALPVAVYEMVLATWLIIKGFNSTPA